MKDHICEMPLALNIEAIALDIFSISRRQHELTINSRSSTRCHLQAQIPNQLGAINYIIDLVTLIMDELRIQLGINLEQQLTELRSEFDDLGARQNPAWTVKFQMIFPVIPCRISEWLWSLQKKI